MDLNICDLYNITEKGYEICESIIKYNGDCRYKICDSCPMKSKNIKNPNIKTYCFTHIPKEQIDEWRLEFAKSVIGFRDGVEYTEDVLKIEHRDIMGKVGFMIGYQNDEVLKRGEFFDNDIKVMSSEYPDYKDGYLCLKGTSIDKDDNIVIVSIEEFKEIEKQVNKINEKYKIKKGWRFGKGGYYWYVDIAPYFLEDGMVKRTTDTYNYKCDEHRWKIGNYFKTKEEAEYAQKKILELLKNIKNNKED